MMCIHFRQLFKSGPVIVTTRSDVAETRAAAAAGVVPTGYAPGISALPPSFGESLTDETPELSTICLILVPPFPIIIPQQGVGTRMRTTKENPGTIAAWLGSCKGYMGSW